MDYSSLDTAADGYVQGVYVDMADGVRCGSSHDAHVVTPCLLLAGCSAVTTGLLSSATPTITASGEADGFPADGALLDSGSVWQPQTTDDSQWIQATFSSSIVLSAISIQGKHEVLRWIHTLPFLEGFCC